MVGYAGGDGLLIPLLSWMEDVSDLRLIKETHSGNVLQIGILVNPGIKTSSPEQAGVPSAWSTMPRTQNRARLLCARPGKG